WLSCWAAGVSTASLAVAGSVVLLARSESVAKPPSGLGKIESAGEIPGVPSTRATLRSRISLPPVRGLTTPRPGGRAHLAGLESDQRSRPWRRELEAA